MKILEVISTLENRAGAQVMFHTLVKTLARNPSNEIYVLVLRSEINDSFLDLYEENSIKMITLNKKSKLPLLTAIKMRKILKYISPDVIHFHLSCLWTYMFAFGFKQRSWRLYQTYHTLPKKNKFSLVQRIEKIFIQNGLSFIGISKLISEKICECYKVKKCSFVYNGIELRHKNNFDYVQHKCFRFVCVAGFRPVKNHIMLINAFDYLYKNEANIELYLVGCGETMKNCKEYVSKLDSCNNIKFCGSVDDPYSILNQSDCFILSSFYEGNPMSILEAMDCGLPVIAPNIGGIPDVIKDNVNGFLFNTGELKSIIFAMEKIINTKNRSFFSKNNIIKVKQFDNFSMAEGYEQIFKSMSENKN